MALNAESLARLAAILPAQDVRLVVANANVVDDIANRWKARVRTVFDELNERALDIIEATGEIPASFGDEVFEAIADTFMRHELETVFAADRSARPHAVRLARKVIDTVDPTKLRTLAIAAGAYIDKKKMIEQHLTHTWDEATDRTLCRRVEPDNVATWFSDPEQEKMPPTCSICFARDPRFVGTAQPSTAVKKKEGPPSERIDTSTPAMDIDVTKQGFDAIVESLGLQPMAKKYRVTDGGKFDRLIVAKRVDGREVWISTIDGRPKVVYEQPLAAAPKLEESKTSMPAPPDTTPPPPTQSDPMPTAPEELHDALDAEEQGRRPIHGEPPPRTPPPTGGDGGGSQPPKKWPNDTAKIRALWDRWRKTGRLPGRTREQAAAVKVLYIRRVQTLMQKRASEFIKGEPRETGRDEKGVFWNPDAFNRESAKQAIEEEAAVGRARASTIIETETTRYYNTTRVNVYNAIDSVVAYYFVCVRDHATTRWCRSRNHAVFTKGTELLRKNTPPCHYNCRSELLPLSKLNPAHRKLLEDASLRAENRVFVPLLPEWNT